MKSIQAICTAILLLSFVSTVFGEDRVYTLKDAYNSALNSNEYIKIAEENVLQSDSRIDQAWSYLYPRLVGQVGYTKYTESLPPGGGSFIFQPTDQFRAALVLTQPLYTGGRTFAALRTAKKMQEASTSGLSSVRQDILIRVSEVYYSVLKAQKAVEIGSRSLERMERHKQVTEQEAATRKTKVNVSALLRANTLVSQARINLVRARSGLKVAKEKLYLIAKLPVDAVIIEPEPLDQPAEGLDRLKEAAFGNRDDYAGLKLGQSIAAENVTIVKGGHSPQIYAEAGIRYLDSQPATFADATSYYGGLRLQVPIFEGGMKKAEVSEARSRQRQAELSTEAMRKSIESDVHEAFVNLQTITSVLETARLQRGYAKDNFDAVEGLFDEGLAPSLSIIDAEQALTYAERELVNATYDRQVAILRLKKSIGMLGKEKQ